MTKEEKALRMIISYLEKALREAKVQDPYSRVKELISKDGKRGDPTSDFSVLDEVERVLPSVLKDQ